MKNLTFLASGHRARSPLSPAVEFSLGSSGIEKENTKGSKGEPAAPVAPPLRGPLAALLRFRTFEALRHRQYRLIWYGQIFASMGTWMDQVTRGWLIYELTDSALQLGLVRGIQAIPFLLLSPIAGSAADRYSRKMQVVLTQTADGILFAVMALLIFTGQIQPWHAYVTAVLMAMGPRFAAPARAPPI